MPESIVEILFAKRTEDMFEFFYEDYLIKVAESKKPILIIDAGNR